jgi:para-aminobenzoate synthetase component I
MRQFIPISIPPHEHWCHQLRHEVAMHDCGVMLETSSAYLQSEVGGLRAKYQLLAGVGAVEVVRDDYSLLCAKSRAKKDWWFGAFAYDLKNRFDNLASHHFDFIAAPELCFFRPRYVVLNEGSGMQIGYLAELDTPTSVFEWVEKVSRLDLPPINLFNISCRPQIEFDGYRQAVHDIKRHIAHGDIYEMNYCMAFHGHQLDLDTVGLYSQLLDASPVPYAAFAKFNDVHLLSASPERYVCKRGGRVYSQPIKGTSPRSNDPIVDEQSRIGLYKSEKERAENIMIVDLVRNDLAKVAKQGSVLVDELCGVYGYRQVYQMISTISCELAEGLDWLDVIQATFPMGSMTGAPKLRAMELIEQFENTKRGLYSGAVGYVSPDGDFDFNVVIRSILYNSSTGNLSFSVGSAITHLSDAEAEYNECLLKAKAMMQVLGAKL